MKTEKKKRERGVHILRNVGGIVNTQKVTKIVWRNSLLALDFCQ